MTQLWKFHGGLKLDSNKAMSNERPIAPCPLPPKLIIPIQQHIGEPGELLVNVGDTVLKGQPLTKATGYVSAAKHAPTSGTITDIGEYPIAHPSGLSALCVVIAPDGKDSWITHEGVADYLSQTPVELRNRARHCGIVGLGGATFPTSVKMNPAGQAIETLIINGAECEPYITCDDRLMRERADEVVLGADILLHAVGARECVIAVEDNKPEAILALRHALQKQNLDRINIVAIPTIYPTGGEKQLIKVLTGQEVPSHGLPVDIGLLMQNVGTAAAIYRAVVHGEPLISRIVTVTGEAVAQPQNLEVLIGTPMQHVIEQCGGYRAEANRLIMGGPMMGIALQSDEVPVTKGCNCLLVQHVEPAEPAMPCIRCGECTRVCPASLLPQQLYWHASSKNFDHVQDYHLFDCIECGCCAQVCPSHIPLVQYYRFAKTEIWHQEREKRKSDHARVRHDFRQARLDREKHEREEALRKKKELLAQKAAADAATGIEDPKKAAIAAALERTKAKKSMTTESDAASTAQTSATENDNKA